MLYEHMAPLFDSAPLFAHQFGWDEILMFAVPIVLALIGVRYAESRAAGRQSAQHADEEGPSNEPVSKADSTNAGADDPGD
jgi:hypothetical protein